MVVLVEVDQKVKVEGNAEGLRDSLVDKLAFRVDVSVLSDEVIGSFYSFVIVFLSKFVAVGIKVRSWPLNASGSIFLCCFVHDYLIQDNSSYPLVFLELVRES